MASAHERRRGELPALGGGDPGAAGEDGLGAEEALAMAAPPASAGAVAERADAGAPAPGSGKCAARAGRSRRGALAPKVERVDATRPHQIWTIDFKGHFRTGDGCRCDPLTVRDLYSRALLLVEHVPAQSEAAVRAALRRCFQRHGVPKTIRVDNGAPFGGCGALGLSRTSVWWVRQGIEVEFGRPAKPQDNGAHEQMHRVLKAATAAPPGPTLRAQGRRFAVFCRHYNEERPHQALGGDTPCRHFRRNPRRYREPAPLQYPAGWQTLQVRAGGRVAWRGRERLIGRAFAGERIGLRSPAERTPAMPEVMEVYLGTLLLGELHTADSGGMRPLQRRAAAPPRTAARA